MALLSGVHFAAILVPFFAATEQDMVPFLQTSDWLCGEEKKTNRKPKLRGGMRAWGWDWLEGKWTTAVLAGLTPGRIVCVAADCGGYLPNSHTIKHGPSIEI